MHKQRRSIRTRLKEHNFGADFCVGKAQNAANTSRIGEYFNTAEVKISPSKWGSDASPLLKERLFTKKRLFDALFVAAWLSLTAALVLFVIFMLHKNTAKEVDRATLLAALPEESLSSLSAGEQATLYELYGPEESGWDYYILYTAPDIMDVSELLIVRSENAAALAAALTAVEARHGEQISVFESYGPTQTAALKAGHLYTRGDYLFYAVGNEADALRTAFERTVS